MTEPVKPSARKWQREVKLELTSVADFQRLDDRPVTVDIARDHEDRVFVVLTQTSSSIVLDEHQLKAFLSAARYMGVVE